MDLPAIRLKFKEHVAGLADDLTDVEVDAFLNRAYRWVIPADIDGEFSETIWQLQLTAGTQEYPYPDSVVAPRATSAWIKSYTSGASTVELGAFFLDIETDPAVFEYDDETDGAVNARPQSILFFGRTVRLDAPPDLDYIVQIPARGGPDADLAATGLTNSAHSMAVITSAAWEFLAESEDLQGAQREDALYQRYKGILHVQAQTKPQHRYRARSF